MKYPLGKEPNKSKEKIINYSNRGMDLESDINITNEYYRSINKAFIYKKPTPIQVVKVDYSKNKKITEAYFKESSTTDYNGIYKGKYIDFEAKVTKTLSFPIKNIKEHQIDHLIKIKENGGISFIIVRFEKKQENYLLETKRLEEILQENIKTIKLEFFKKFGYLIPIKYKERIDYLKIIDELYGDILWKIWKEVLEEMKTK